MRQILQTMIKVHQTLCFYVQKNIYAFTSDFYEHFHFNKFIQGNIFKKKGNDFSC